MRRPAAHRRRCTADAGGDPELGAVVRPADAQCSRQEGVPGVPARGVLRGEHNVLARLRGAEARGGSRRGRGEGALHIRGLHLYTVAEGGVAGLARAGDREPQHGGADAAHLRRGAAADLHAHAPRLLPALPQLPALQDPGAALGRGARPRRRRRRRTRPRGALTPPLHSSLTCK